MRAAQNSSDPIDVVSSVSAAFLKLVMDLPGWLRATVVVVLASLLAARLCIPPLLRAIDDHMLALKARDTITRGEDWVAVLRIRNEPRRLFGRATATEPPTGAAGEGSATSQGGTGPRPDDNGGDAADEPP